MPEMLGRESPAPTRLSVDIPNEDPREELRGYLSTLQNDEIPTAADLVRLNTIISSASENTEESLEQIIPALLSLCIKKGYKIQDENKTLIHKCYQQIPQDPPHNPNGNTLYLAAYKAAQDEIITPSSILTKIEATLAEANSLERSIYPPLLEDLELAWQKGKQKGNEPIDKQRYRQIAESIWTFYLSKSSTQSMIPEITQTDTEADKQFKIFAGCYYLRSTYTPLNELSHSIFMRDINRINTIMLNKNFRNVVIRLETLRKEKMITGFQEEIMGMLRIHPLKGLMQQTIALLNEFQVKRDFNKQDHINILKQLHVFTKSATATNHSHIQLDALKTLEANTRRLCYQNTYLRRILGGFLILTGTALLITAIFPSSVGFSIPILSAFIIKHISTAAGAYISAEVACGLIGGASIATGGFFMKRKKSRIGMIVLDNFIQAAKPAIEGQNIPRQRA